MIICPPPGDAADICFPQHPRQGQVGQESVHCRRGLWADSQLNNKCGLQRHTTAHLASHCGHPTSVDCKSDLAALLVLYAPNLWFPLTKLRAWPTSVAESSRGEGMPCLPADCVVVTVLLSRSLITGSVLVCYVIYGC